MLRTRRFLLILIGLLASASAQAQMLYPGMHGPALRAAIRADYTPDQTLGYDRGRDSLYAYEQRVNGQVCGVYTAYCVTLTPGVDPSTDAFNKGINAEHVLPQSWGASAEPTKSDLHHLFPSRDNVNSSRGNHPFAEIPDGETTTWYRLAVSQTSTPTTNLNEWSERSTSHPDPAFAARFEPREDRAGDIARAVFYIATIYEAQVAAAGGEAFVAVQIPDLLDWHVQDVPSAVETARNQWIATRQGTANPFILDPTLAARAFSDITGEEPEPEPEPEPPGVPVVWINEIHYDNEGTDTGESIEVAGTAGTNLAGYRLVLYNGNGGAFYHDLALTGTIDNEQNGMGAVAFPGPSGGIQNGAPDGVALIAPGGAVVEFLSYEGVTTAADGPAAGLTSTDIGVAETGTTPVGFSLGLTGTGRTSSAFAWSGPSAASPGSLNPGQTIAPAPAVGTWVAARVLLEGAYTPGLPGGALMRTEIEDALPLAQPYAAAPWAYAGAEAIPATDANANGRPDLLDAHDVVDWVLVSLRATPEGADLHRAAALLLADGTLLDPGSGSASARTAAPSGSYYVVVTHRTHLAAMSAAPAAVSGAVPGAPLDLSASAASAYGAQGVKQLAAGVFALYAGDGDGDGAVLSTDRQAVWLPQVGQTGYLAGDFSLDGSVLADDRQGLWTPNVGVQSAVPGAVAGVVAGASGQ